VLIMVSVIAASLWKKELPVIAEAPAFELTDQSGVAVTNKTLAGRPYIADLIFTQCAGPCPVMTAKMAKLSREIESADVQFVSFSVDPERDTPALLKEYAGKFKADESRWNFLTGPSDVIFATAKGLLVTALPADEKNPIIHEERFILVDGHGKIRGYYSSKDEEAMARLKADASSLVHD
jgi:cytochrome oxidase Cu insertion factor (SCO1/SenC/PrrC family)